MAAMDAKLAKSLKIEDESNMMNFDKVPRLSLHLQFRSAMAKWQLEHDSPRYTSPHLLESFTAANWNDISNDLTTGYCFGSCAD
jgi:hypothetical protein